jgi:type IV secretion system protein VirB5
LANASQASGAFPVLASDVRSAVNSNAVLSSAQLATLSSADQQQIVAAREAAALRQALAQEALVNASDRFAALQSLIAAISTAVDQKAILDLQTRISAELGMVQNEQTKLQILAQASQAQDSAIAQREREQVIAGQGRFSSRFRPTP